VKVLIVEDDDQIRTLVRTSLEQHDIDVAGVADVAGAQVALDGTAFDVVILDLTLPDGSGIEILERVHVDFPSSHVIILSGATGELDRIRGLELGADDYVVKPFSARELAARVLAVRRRRTPPQSTRLSFGPFELDLVARRLLSRGAPVEMTDAQFAMLAHLAVRAGHVFSRAELVLVARRSGSSGESEKTVRADVRRVRELIEPDPRRPTFLRGVRGAGYRFDMPRNGRPEVEGDVRHQPGTVITVDSRIVTADREAAALLGVQDPSELHGAHVLDFVAPQSLRSALERIRLLAAANDARSQVFVVVHPDGTELPVQVDTAETEWEGAAAVELRVRAASEESPRLRLLLTGVLSEVTDAVVVTDIDMHVRSWNRAAERLYGWSETEVLGRHLLDVVASGAHEGEWDLIRAELERADEWHGETHQLTRDGSVIEVRASVTVARDDGGNTVGMVTVNRLVTSPPADAPVTRHGTDILRGLGAGEFEVYYQPVVDLRDSHVVTVEALVRWNHPHSGLLAPDLFIDTAEQSGAIHELGTFVLATASRQVAAWRRDGTQVALAVNLSARELGDPHLVEHVTATIAASGLDLDVLWLEVTETALIEDVAQASRLLRELAALGIGISIDDFGTGWASLTYLRSFPVHALKIDRSFVTGVDRDPNSATIVRSILALGAELGLAVVAEGIETRAEADALVALGCRLGQGYLYGRPVPAAEVDLTKMLPLHRREGSVEATMVGGL
jgi:PAS domain S-box-containing protein